MLFHAYDAIMIDLIVTPHVQIKLFQFMSVSFLISFTKIVVKSMVLWQLYY